MPRLTAEQRQQRNEIIAQMRQMHEDGKTYQEIGDMFGVSRQRIFQMIGGGDVKFFRKITPSQCIYKGIRKYMNDNKVSMMEMSRKVYGNTSPNNYQKTKGWLNGSLEIAKGRIDKLLAVTGLSYEVAFKIESEA